MELIKWIKSPNTIHKYPEFISSAMSGQKLGSILQNADYGDIGTACQLYKEILSKEPTINGLVYSRLQQVASNKVFVIPQNDSKEEIEIAQYGVRILKRLKLLRKTKQSYILENDISGVNERLALAFWYGFRVPWIYYDTPQGFEFPIPIALEFFDNTKFYLDTETQELRLITSYSDYYGTPLSVFDDRLYLEVRYTRFSDSMAHSGIARACCYPWFMSWISWQHLMRYIEKLSVGSLLLKQSENARQLSEDSINDAKEFIKNYITGTDFIVPNGWEAQLLQAVNGGRNGVFMDVKAIVDDAYQFLILSQTATNTAKGTAKSGNNTSREVMEKGTLSGDKKLVASSLRDLLAKPIKMKYGYDAPIPLVAVGDTFNTGVSMPEKFFNRLINRKFNNPLVKCHILTNSDLSSMEMEKMENKQWKCD